MSEKNNVSVGKPKVAGAVYRAPVGTTLPTDATSTLNQAFKGVGYVSEDGVTNTISKTTQKIKEWGGAVVLVTQTESSDQVKMKLIESLNEEVLKAVFGDSNVSGSLASGITVTVDGDEAEEYAWVIDMVLRNSGVKRLVFPSMALVALGDIVYKSDTAIAYDCTFEATPDGSGNTHYEYIKRAAGSSGSSGS